MSVNKGKGNHSNNTIHMKLIYFSFEFNSTSLEVQLDIQVNVKQYMNSVWQQNKILRVKDFFLMICI